jgi:hypothetical protein
MLASAKPGQMIKLTVTKKPNAAGGVKTLERLMRQDPATKKGLKNAYKARAATTITYNRGNRDWVKRQSCGKLVRVIKGASWTMPFTVDLAADLKSVEKYLKVENA